MFKSFVLVALLVAVAFVRINKAALFSSAALLLDAGLILMLPGGITYSVEV
jgi:hypothetical protein